MIPRWIELYKDKSLGGDAGTETFPIKRNNQILELMLRVRAKNGANHNSASDAAQQTIEESLSKIEVKSGSASFKNYTAEICRKLATYRNGKLPYTMHTQIAGGAYAGNDDPDLGWQEYLMPIYFNSEFDVYGEKTNVMFPAPLYDSLDLVLEYDFTISDDAGFLTGGSNHLFDLYALVMPRESQDAMMNKRILVETKKQDYTTVASGDEPFDLTLSKDKFLRRLLVFCYETGIEEGIDVTDLNLKVDGDSVWAGKWGDLQAMNAEDARLTFEYNIWTKSVGTDDTIYTRVPACRPMFTARMTTTVVPWAARAGDQVTIDTTEADDIGLLQVGSPVLPASAVFDFDRAGDLGHMQYCGVNDLDIVLTNGGAGGAVQFIEQHIAKVWGV